MCAFLCVFAIPLYFGEMCVRFCVFLWSFGKNKLKDWALLHYFITENFEF